MSKVQLPSAELFAVTKAVRPSLPRCTSKTLTSQTAKPTYTSYCELQPLVCRAICQPLTQRHICSKAHCHKLGSSLPINSQPVSPLSQPQATARVSVTSQCSGCHIIDLFQGRQTQEPQVLLVPLQQQDPKYPRAAKHHRRSHAQEPRLAHLFPGVIKDLSPTAGSTTCLCHT